MRLENYIDEVLRTEKSEMAPFASQLLHSIIGLVTESGELLEGFHNLESSGVLECNWPTCDAGLNLLEELGDTFWYHVLGMHSINLSYKTTASPAFPINELERCGLRYYIDECILHSAKLLDIYKCAVFYKRVMDMTQVRVHYQDILTAVLSIIQLLGSTEEEVLAMNSAKLRKRYPVEDGYSNEAANTRNLEEEQEALKANRAKK